MARGGKFTKKRKIEADPVYKSVLVAKFINRSMRDGKKTVAQKVIYDSFDKIKKEGLDPLRVFENAIDNVGPRFEVRSRRIGGAAYQVPSEVRGERRVSLAIRWILAAANKRPSKEYKSFSNKLAAEFLDASKNVGEAMKKRDIAHRMAEANKAFAHFRW